MELKDKQGAMSDKESVTENMIGMRKKRQEIDYIYLGFECQTCRKEYTNDNLVNAEGKGKKTTIKVDSESMPLENLTKDKLRDVATSPLWKFLDDDQKRDKVTELVNKRRYREGKKLLPTDSPIQVMDCPQQCSPEDNAFYVCKFMQWSYKEKNQFLFQEGNFEEKIQKTRAKFAYKILSDKYRKHNVTLVKTMVSKGYVLSKDALTKAKAFDDSIKFQMIAGAKAYEASKYVVSVTGKTASEAAIAFYNSSYFSKGALWVSDALTRATKVAADLGIHAGKK
ncbi:hypothetical protein IFM89_039792 [Coptis chinensis]|uniref:Uncharacterized protein n=1 Tax=Coptis chinensis TaxID=261450 RepID=A0A835GUZ5_9MAGN|nr:hypothetical protein IFM89_039792 [Coptis chinensis]